MGKAMKIWIQMKMIFIFLLCIISCNNFHANNNQEYSLVGDSLYKSDSSKIIELLRSDLEFKRGGYTSEEFYDGTNIYIDTIIYSPLRDKFVIFVITENKTSRKLLPEQHLKWFYSGDCYLGKRYSGDSIFITLSGPRLTNGVSKKQIKNDMYDTYFTTFSKFKDINGKLKYKYNLGDIRFWDSSIWDELERTRIRREEFEKEKKENPSNIYEPKNRN